MLVKRKYPPNAGRWALPGGLVELGESVQEAALREVKEEVGLAVEIEGLLDVVTEVVLDARKRPLYHYILVDYVARPLSNTVSLNPESAGWKWVSRSEASRLRMSDNTRRALSNYFDRKKHATP